MNTHSSTGEDGWVDARQWRPREEFELKVVACDESVEVYVDHQLMIHQVRHRETSGRLGCLVERGEAAFQALRLWQFTA